MNKKSIIPQGCKLMAARNGIKVLMYHRITDHVVVTNGARDFCVRAKSFRRQLELLEWLGFTPITFNDYRLVLDGELNLPKKPVILTFDDGYVDTFEIAFPLLEEFGMKGVVFALGDRSISHNVWDAHDGLANTRLMTDQQILEMHAAGHEIGSHSMSHPKLTLLPREKAWEEISRSRMLLEMLLNAPVRSFSYPYGLVNEMLKNMVADAGYSLACGVYTGPARFGLDPFELRRIAVPGSLNSVGFGVRMLAPYSRYQWLRRKAKDVLMSPSTFGQSRGHAISLPEINKTNDIALKDLS